MPTIKSKALRDCSAHDEHTREHNERSGACGAPEMPVRRHRPRPRAAPLQAEGVRSIADPALPGLPAGAVMRASHPTGQRRWGEMRARLYRRLLHRNRVPARRQASGVACPLRGGHDPGGRSGEPHHAVLRVRCCDDSVAGHLQVVARRARGHRTADAHVARCIGPLGGAWSRRDGCHLACRRAGRRHRDRRCALHPLTGQIVTLTGVTLASAVVRWFWSAIKFQADMGVLLAFLFLLSMVGALVLPPARACFLFPRRVRGSMTRIFARRRRASGSSAGSTAIEPDRYGKRLHDRCRALGARLRTNQSKR